MELNLNTWHTKLYLESRYCWYRMGGGKLSKVEYLGYAFNPVHDRWEDKDWSSILRTNLCQYMRFIMVWYPLWIVMNLIPIMLFLAAALYYPSTFFGTTSYLISVLMILAALVALLLAFFGLNYVVGWISKFPWAVNMKTSMTDWSVRRVQARINRPEKGPGFFKLFMQYLSDRKERFCSNINITEGGQ